MPRGRSPHAAGPASTGTAPILAQIAREISNRHTRKTACRAGRHSSRITVHEETSNRHLVRLKFHATQEESTTSLFLIDPKQPNCSAAFHLRDLSAKRSLRGRPFHHQLAAPSHTAAISNRHIRIANRHLVQLEITASRAESTTSLFLIDPKQQSCSRGIACRAGCAFPSGSPAEGDGALQRMVERGAGSSRVLQRGLQVEVPARLTIRIVDEHHAVF